MSTQINAMTPAQQSYVPFVIPSASGYDAELMEDMDGFTPTFERIKIPGGGVTQFEMPSDDPSQPNYEPKLEVAILYTHGSNAYWPEGSEYDDDTPPLCQAADGKFGYGAPGGVCQTCALNKFGSDSRGTGKACKNMRTLYVLRSGDRMPFILSLPPTSIKAWREFFNKTFWYRGRNVYSSLVEITLKRKSSNGFDYGVASFRVLRDFEGEELEQITRYAQSFRQQAKDSVEQRKEMNKAAAAETVELAAGAMELPDNGAHFSVSPGLINGDLAKLPA